MNSRNCESDRVKAALFVDFDNIYTSLLRIDPGAAKRFARTPMKWIEWIESGMPGEQDSVLANPRRAVLIRRCYLNLSEGYRQFCRDFTHAGFSVMACSPLTSHGKNSADIHMVIDILDTLQHHMHVDEFIIMSGDTDFMPVLLRLRAYDRRTMIISVNGAASAYTTASDHSIGGDIFIKQALGLSPKNLFDEIAKRVCTIASARGYIAASDLRSLFQEFSEYRELPGDHLLGFATLRELTDELRRRCPDLQVVDGHPWKVIVQKRLPSSEPPKNEPNPPEPAQPDRPSETPTNSPGIKIPACPTPTAAYSDLVDKIIAEVQQILAQSSEHIRLSRVAHQIREVFGEQIDTTHWAGAYHFKTLLQNANKPDIAVSRDYVYDPRRHRAPQAASRNGASSQSPQPHSDARSIQRNGTLEHEPSSHAVLPTSAPTIAASGGVENLREPPNKLTPLIQKVHQATSIPPLTTEQYAVVFQALSDSLQEHPYDAKTTIEEVQKRCIMRNVHIWQAQLSLILKGMVYIGHKLGIRPQDDTPPKLATSFRDVVIKLCRSTQLELSADEYRLIDTWIRGAGEERDALEKQIGSTQ